MCSYSTVSDWLGARFFLERPPARKFLPTWSLPCVLEALAKAPFEPLAEASLRDVTIKTVFLMAIASGHRRSALRARPPATFVEMGCAWYRTPHMWLRIRRLLLSLSRFSYPASLGTLIGVRRQGLVSWSTFRVLRTGGRATSFSFARGSLFPPLREMSFRSGLWLLSAQLAPRCCRPGLRLVHTTPGASDASWALFTGVFPLRRSGSLLAVA